MLTKAEILRLRSLREKKHREALGVFVIEGEKVVGELLAAHFPFVEIYATDAWLVRPLSALSLSTPSPGSKTERERAHAPAAAPPDVRAISPEEMSRVSHFPTPSSVLAIGRIARADLQREVLRRGLTLALDGVQDAGNVGTLLRVADWFGFDRVVLSLDCADLFHQKVINASMGSFARVTTYTADLAAALAEVVEGAPDTMILGCQLEGDDVHTLPALRDAVVVIGSEGRGLSPAVAAQVTRRVAIPRYGAAESLNAAIAAAIVCDNLRRINSGAPPGSAAS